MQSSRKWRRLLESVSSPTSLVLRRCALLRGTAPAVSAVLVGLLLASCATTQSRYIALGQKVPPRAEDCSVAIFKETPPQKAFERTSRLDVHIEKTHFLDSDFESALPELRKQACLSGADAIIDIQERSTRHLENRAYHVTATGIKFKE